MARPRGQRGSQGRRVPLEGERQRRERRWALKSISRCTCPPDSKGGPSVPVDGKMKLLPSVTGDCRGWGKLPWRGPAHWTRRKGQGLGPEGEKQSHELFWLWVCY